MPLWYNFEMKKDSGFIQLIILIIVLVLITFYFGKDPVVIWEKLKPIFIFILSLFVKIIDFTIKSVSELLSK